MKKMTLFVNYCDPHSILVVNIEGALRRLFCPFRVLCIGSLHAIPKDSWVIVEEVSNSANDELLFIVGGKSYSHKHFHIIIHF